MDERLRFVARLLEGEKMAPLCAEFGISRKTGYKIFDRYKDTGVTAFTDRSRRPYRQANRLPAPIEATIVRLKREYPGWGGIDVGVAQTVISEVGVDMTRWQTEGHFASWLGLCPDNRSSGDRVLRKGTRHVVNRAATALRMAATTLLRSQSYLGAQYRRLRGRLGAPKAITAMAHKLARLVYRMLKWGHAYVDKGLQYYEERHRQQQVQLLKKRAAKLGLHIIEPQAAV